MKFSFARQSPLCLCIFTSLVVLFLNTSAHGGFAVKVKESGGKEDNVQLYSGSYALLIGASKYMAGWPSLESIPGELDSVEKLLQRKGFLVKRVYDPDSKQLKDAFTSFINSYGYDQNNRLLVFFSGHGYTRKNGKKGRQQCGLSVARSMCCSCSTPAFPGLFSSSAINPSRLGTLHG